MSTAPVTVSRTRVHARKPGFVADLLTIAGRALRAIPREPAAVIPPRGVPVFFFGVNVGSLQTTAQDSGLVPDYKAFQVPVAIIFAVTGISRAAALVTDIQTGYFDRLLMTPVRRLTLLLGLMIADFALVVALSIPVLMLGYAVGVRFETGIAGGLVFLLLA
ncbi:MAG: ABC transporter permease, partial [Acidimicrobiia bacterium]